MPPRLHQRRAGSLRREPWRRLQGLALNHHLPRNCYFFARNMARKDTVSNDSCDDESLRCRIFV